MKTNNSAIVSACEGEGEVVEFEEGEAADSPEFIAAWNAAHRNDQPPARNVQAIIPAGWEIDRCEGGEITVVNADGGYLASNDPRASIASTVLWQLADALLKGDALPAGDVGAGWQPISSAPKDGTRVLIWQAGFWQTAKWQDGSTGAEAHWPVGWRTSLYVYPDVEWWAPLPPSPIATLPSQAEGQEVRT